MNKIIALFSFIMVLSSCREKPVTAAHDKGEVTIAPADAPVMTFEKEIYDFGSVKEGEKVQYNFKFKNTGKTPLIITDATATCGCTLPEVPKEPVNPGKEGVIKVVFNSQGKMGLNDKVITVISNANPPKNRVHLVGEVTASK